MAVLYAHSDASDDRSSWQTLDDHLDNVACRAEQYASVLGVGSWGRALGLLHDLGKARQQFQKRLEGSTESVDHSTYGAKHACEQYGELGELAALCVAGHHGGIPNWSTGSEGRTCLKQRIENDAVLDNPTLSYVENRDGLLPDSQSMTKELQQFLFANGLPPASKGQAGFRMFAFTHYIFSALVDADYVDTEQFMEPERSELRGNRRTAPLSKLWDLYCRHMDTLEAGAADTDVNRYRRYVRESCLKAADNPVGIFELSVDTGGGKTLASTGFALKHALNNGLDRIIFAIPYTSIVEQTAQVLRNIFGDENVLEHHSNYDFDSQDEEKALSERLACQNWDAPIIVTTNVQLFESLFSNKPSKSRKVHNIAHSVIILDEAQTLPDHLLKPTLAMIETLPSCFESSVVLCTATQPNLEGVWPYNSQVTTMVGKRADAPSIPPRTSFANLGTQPLSDLCKQMLQKDQVLCIVGKKSEAIDIYRLLKDRLEALGYEQEGLFCLTTYLTPDDRTHQIADIRARLRDGRRCVVVSTQLIEAGVDVDFPVVYRELAGIDSLYQAAGRCNREGKRGSVCPVYVFDAEDENGERICTSKWLEKLKDISRMVISENNNVIDDTLISRFFAARYGGGQPLDKKGEKAILPMAEDSHKTSTSQHASIADEYRIIDSEAIPVFVRCGDEAETLYQRIREEAYPAALARAAQRFSIGLRQKEIDRLRKEGALEELCPFLVLDANDGCRVLYDSNIGFHVEGDEELLTLTV